MIDGKKTPLRTTEVVPLGDHDKDKVLDHQCQGFGGSFPDPNVMAVTGGFVQDQPLVCGGFKEPDLAKTVHPLCYAIGKSRIMAVMKQERAYSASLPIIVDTTISNEKRLWVTGGKGKENNRLKSTEFIASSSEQGPQLPFPMADHCLLELNYATALTIGGSSLKASMMFDISKKAFQLGPSLAVARYGHACGVVAIGTQMRAAIVTGGYSEQSKMSLQTTEMLVLDNADNTGQWSAGPNFPASSSFRTGGGVTVPDGTFVVTGGQSQTTSVSYIFQLDCRMTTAVADCQWIKLEHELEIGRAGHLALLVPETYDCHDQNQGENVLADPSNTKGVYCSQLTIFTRINLCQSDCMNSRRHPSCHQRVCQSW